MTWICLLCTLDCMQNAYSALTRELLELDTETGILSLSAELFECLPTDTRYLCCSSGRHSVARSLSLPRQQLAYPSRTLSFPLQPSLPDRCSAHHRRISPTATPVRGGQRCRPALVSLPAKIHCILTTRNWGNSRYRHNSSKVSRNNYKFLSLLSRWSSYHTVFVFGRSRIQISAWIPPVLRLSWFHTVSFGTH